MHLLSLPRFGGAFFYNYAETLSGWRIENRCRRLSLFDFNVLPFFQGTYQASPYSRRIFGSRYDFRVYFSTHIEGGSCGEICADKKCAMCAHGIGLKLLSIRCGGVRLKFVRKINDSAIIVRSLIFLQFFPIAPICFFLRPRFLKLFFHVGSRIAAAGLVILTPASITNPYLSRNDLLCRFESHHAAPSRGSASRKACMSLSSTTVRRPILRAGSRPSRISL